MRRRKTGELPPYRFHKSTGHARVVIDGVTHWLGRHGTPESRERYDRLVGEWMARGRKSRGDETAVAKYERALEQARVAADVAGELAAERTIAEVMEAYWGHAQATHQRDGQPTDELTHVRLALRPVRQLYAMLPAREFGPLKLKAVRQQFIDRGHSRAHIKSNVQRIRRMFRWAAENELVPAAIYVALTTVEGLRRGQAKGGRVVKPVPLDRVEAVLSPALQPDGSPEKYADGKGRFKYVNPEVEAIVRLQMLTGARSSELLSMRTADITTGGELWCYRPARHKTEHHGATREIWFGRTAQEVLRPWLRTNLTEFLFSPARAKEREWAEKRSKRKTRVQPSQQCRKKQSGRKRSWRDRFTRDTYYKAIVQACEKVWPLPAELTRLAGETAMEWRTRLGDRWPEVADWRRDHYWHPHQLRHNRGTEIRREFGLEAAKASLGHRDIRATQLYAEKDAQLAQEVARRIG